MTTNNIYVLVTERQNNNSLPLAERFFDTLDEAKAWRPYDDPLSILSCVMQRMAIRNVAPTAAKRGFNPVSRTRDLAPYCTTGALPCT